MITRTSDELKKIKPVEELENASLRRNGTLRSPVPILVVYVGEEILHI